MNGLHVLRVTNVLLTMWLNTSKYLRKTFLLIGIGILASSISWAQELNWVHQIGGQGRDVGTGITSDQQGNIYVIGRFQALTDMDPSSDATMLKAKEENGDAFLAKYDKDDHFIWATPIKTKTPFHSYIVKLDHKGYIYVAGNSTKTTGYDLWPGILTSHLKHHPFAVLNKYTVDGEREWSKELHKGRLADFSLDTLGNFYVTGLFGGTVDFNHSRQDLPLKNNGTSNTYLAKYNAKCELQWAKNLGARSFVTVNRLELDQTGSIYCSGSFHGESDFNGGDPKFILTPRGNRAGDIFITKHANDGTFQWVRQSGGNTPDHPADLAIGPNGNLYLSGTFGGRHGYIPGAQPIPTDRGCISSMFLEAYDQKGTKLWRNVLGGSGHGGPMGLNVSEENVVFVNGYLDRTTDFDPSAGQNYMAAIGGKDIFVAQYAADGQFIAARQMGGSGHAQLSSLRLIPGGGYFLTGAFSNEVYFEPERGRGRKQSIGNADIFIARYGGNFEPLSPPETLAEKETPTANDQDSIPATIDDERHARTTVVPEWSALQSPLISTVNIYPNPTRTQITVKFDKNLPNATLYLQSLEGKVLRTIPVGNQQLISIDLKKYAAGMYLVQVHSNEHKATFKVIKE